MRIGIKVNPLNPFSLEVLPHIRSILEPESEIQVYDSDANIEEMYVWKMQRQKEVDLLISLGGDGTMLTSGRFAFQQEVPLLGVNLKRFGFLTEITYEEFPRWAPMILQQKYALEPRCVLEAQIGEKSCICINDFVIREIEPIKTSHISLNLDGEEFSDLPADGVIVATPTGSTAYTLSVGGPIVHPQIRGITVSLIAPHLLTFRPLVMPTYCKVGVRIHRPGSIIIDGQYALPLKPEKITMITGSKQTISIVRLKGTTFYYTLQKKFQWGTGR